MDVTIVRLSNWELNVHYVWCVWHSLSPIASGRSEALRVVYVAYMIASWTRTGLKRCVWHT